MKRMVNQQMEGSDVQLHQNKTVTYNPCIKAQCKLQVRLTYEYDTST